jgi:hypothetical protein
MKARQDFPYSAVFASNAELEGSTAFLLGRPCRFNPYAREIRMRQAGGSMSARLWADAGAWRRGWQRASEHRSALRGQRRPLTSP